MAHQASVGGKRFVQKCNNRHDLASSPIDRWLSGLRPAGFAQQNRHANAARHPVVPVGPEVRPQFFGNASGVRALRMPKDVQHEGSGCRATASLLALMHRLPLAVDQACSLGARAARPIAPSFAGVVGGTEAAAAQSHCNPRKVSRHLDNLCDLRGFPLEIMGLRLGQPMEHARTSQSRSPRLVRHAQIDAHVGTTTDRPCTMLASTPSSEATLDAICRTSRHGRGLARATSATATSRRVSRCFGT